MPKVKVKADVYAILRRAVEEGINFGWMRALKYADKPDENTVKYHMDIEIMNAICEVVKFD